MVPALSRIRLPFGSKDEPAPGAENQGAEGSDQGADGAREPDKP